MQDRKQARKSSPAVTIRFRTKKEIEMIRKAAKKLGLSLNTFVASSSTCAAAAELISSGHYENGIPVGFPDQTSMDN